MASAADASDDPGAVWSTNAANPTGYHPRASHHQIWRWLYFTSPVNFNWSIFSRFSPFYKLVENDMIILFSVIFKNKDNNDNNIFNIWCATLTEIPVKGTDFWEHKINLHKCRPKQIRFQIGLIKTISILTCYRVKLPRMCMSYIFPYLILLLNDTIEGLTFSPSQLLHVHHQYNVMAKILK